MQKYDAVVIGAGNGGLAAACRMAKGGKKTLLVERHNLPGGCASSFRRGRFEFETALHEICEWGSKENPGGCRKTCEEFGLDIPWHMVPDNFRVITTASDGKTHIDATLPCTVKEFVNEMERLPPRRRQAGAAAPAPAPAPKKHPGLGKKIAAGAMACVLLAVLIVTGAEARSGDDCLGDFFHDSTSSTRSVLQLGATSRKKR